MALTKAFRDCEDEAIEGFLTGVVVEAFRDSPSSRRDDVFVVETSCEGFRSSPSRSSHSLIRSAASSRSLILYQTSYSGPYPSHLTKYSTH